MLRSLLPVALAALASAVAAPCATAQLNTTVGPAVVPKDGQLSITFSNDQSNAFGISTSYLRVQSVSTGQVVYSDTTFETSILIGPWGWTGFTYGLVDDNGQKLKAGQYRAEVKSDFGAASTLHTFEVVEEGAGLVFEGTPSLFGPFGSNPSPRNFFLQSPSDPGATYFLLGSITATVGVPTCNGTFPLDFDVLLSLSLTPDALFSKSLGTLNAQGRSKAPQFPLPADPAYVGVTLHAAFVVLDPASPCPFARISNAHKMTITG